MHIGILCYNHLAHYLVEVLKVAINMLKYLLRAAKWAGAIIGFAAGTLAIWHYLEPSRTELMLLIGFIGLTILALAQLFQTSEMVSLMSKIAKALEPAQGNPITKELKPGKKSTGWVIGGGVIGGIIGTMIFPGIGTVVGAILGAIVGNLLFKVV